MGKNIAVLLILHKHECLMFKALMLFTVTMCTNPQRKAGSPSVGGSHSKLLITWQPAPLTSREQRDANYWCWRCWWTITVFTQMALPEYHLSLESAGGSYLNVQMSSVSLGSPSPPDMSANNTISDAALVSAGTLFSREQTLVPFLPLCQSSETELERSKTTQVQVDVTQ